MKAQLNLPISGKKNRFAFNSTHETTMNFGTIIPAYVKDLCPNETINVNAQFFARLAPMLVPTFGDIRVNMRAFFVPFSYVWDYWEDYIIGNPSPRPDGSSYVRFTKVPMFRLASLIKMFAENSIFATNSSETQDYDFVVDTATSGHTYVYRKFTKRGKIVFQILQSLGYNFMFTMPYKNTALTDLQDIKFNVLPFLAFCAAYFDNYIPQQYKVVDRFRTFKQWLHEQLPDNSGFVEVPYEKLENLFHIFVLAYSPDYFTTLWQEPNAVLSTGQPNVQQSYYDVVGTRGNRANPSGYSASDQIFADNNDGKVVASVTRNDAVSPWALSLAEKLQGWLTRNNLAGSDYVNRILANFGIKPQDNIGVPRYCGQFISQVKIDSIFDTSGQVAPLGSYAGRGIVPTQGVGQFECTVKEHGMFFVIATCEPKASFTDGLDRLNIYSEKFDFYTPDFDGMNMQAVGQCEMFNTLYDAHVQANNNLPQDVFRTIGYAPRYSERKYSKSRVTGDFNVRHLSTDISAYSLQRNLVKDKFANTVELNSGQSELTLSGIVFQYDDAQYNRVFAATDGYADPLFCLFDFDVKLISPMLPISESFEQYNSSSNSIEVEKNGAYNN